MNEDQISASGERAAIGGYLSQFNLFAWFAYLELVKGELEWIKVADPEAEKLDDIQYSTFSEIHAYQVKWTIAHATISYLDFKALFPSIIESWRKLKALPSSVNKRVIPHLLTNKPLSSNVKIMVNGIRIGTFNDFIHKVWIKLKTNQLIDTQWNPIIDELKTLSKLNESEFYEFIRDFHFITDYKPKEFSISNIRNSKQEEDLERFCRFILEKVADPNRMVLFSSDEIVKVLGWEDRFKTTFNHELVVDKQRYQLIQSTIDLLNLKLNEHDKGYIFLLGGPGTGKSTLLTQWSKNRTERIIKYYAFDFTNPSSQLNFYERGHSTNLFFDLVCQLKEGGVYKRSTLPYKDLIFLKEIFFEQLKAVSEESKSNRRKTILIIDGLDHVPREYKSLSQSFIRELPLPNEIPDGVYILLGSQSYELEDIDHAIKVAYKEGHRTIQIDSLNKKEVYKYLESSKITPVLSNPQKLKVFEKSQGHPLYLAYMIERIQGVKALDEAIESFIPIEGDIENYYNKIWRPIRKDIKLVELLGFISRINGFVNPSFVNEWTSDQSVLRDFKEKAIFLFNDSQNGWTFFHNSFKQFLLHNTAIDYLIDEYDPKKDIEYHKQLANNYKKSQTEPPWKGNYHLFQSEQYDEFIAEVTPESFTSQLIEFRPVEEIRQDIKLGIEIAKRRKDINILIRYLFALAEIEIRLNNIDPASFTEQLLEFGKTSIAINNLRTGSTLRCSETYALKASHLFVEFGDKIEASILFNMAYPDAITESAIKIDNLQKYEEIRNTLEEWVFVAPNFIEINNILSKINNICFAGDKEQIHFQENKSGLRIRLLSNLCNSLINLNKWNELNLVIKEFNSNDKKEANLIFQVAQSAIEKCIGLGDSNRANEFLRTLLVYFKKETTKPIGKIYLADLIYKVTGDLELAFDWIRDVSQPSNVGKDLLGFKGSLDIFMPLIKLNKLLNICGNGVTITNAIPSGQPGTETEILVEFERMLCLTAQI